MNKLALAVAFGLILMANVPFVFAQGMMNQNSSVLDDDHTAREEAEGKEVWQQLQDKQLTCDTLADEQFAALGEYFMGRMMGDSHAAMNQMMIQMMGEEGEEQMHVVMGKRLSGCDTSAAYPAGGGGFISMMNMLALRQARLPDGQGFGGQAGGGFNMMNWGLGMPYGGWGSGMSLFGGLFMVMWWVFIVAGIVWLVKWMMGKSKGQAGTKTALDILKERYARGDINKQEFEDKKKDMV